MEKREWTFTLESVKDRALIKILQEQSDTIDELIDEVNQLKERTNRMEYTSFDEYQDSLVKKIEGEWDLGPYGGICYCNECRKKYKQDYHKPDYSELKKALREVIETI